MILHFDENYAGVLGHLASKGYRHNTVHRFLHTSFKRYINARENITISKAEIHATMEELIIGFNRLHTLFYETPNECVSSQYSEFLSAVIYFHVYKAKNFLAEGSIMRQLREYHHTMDGISPPDIYMTSILGRPLIVSVTRFNSNQDHRVRAENLLRTKIVKSVSSVLASQVMFGADRAIIQIFCKSEKNASILKQTWGNIHRIPPWVYLHIILCKHKKIYEDNGFFR